MVLNLVPHHQGRHPKLLRPIVHLVGADLGTVDSLAYPGGRRQELGGEGAVALLSIGPGNGHECGWRPRRGQVFEQSATEGEADLLGPGLRGQETGAFAIPRLAAASIAPASDSDRA